MVHRRTIGILFSFNESWAGGYYYLLNIISALKTLEDTLLPHIVIFNDMGTKIDGVENVDYPYLTYVPYKGTPTIFSRFVNKLSRMFFGKNVFSFELNLSKVDCILPIIDFREYLLDRHKKKRIYWIPDFQHKYLPHLFTKEEVESRDKNIAAIANSKLKLILSSQDAKDDFSKFFPGYSCFIKVLPFATTLEKFEHLDLHQLKIKYDISEKYFFVPNQFWVHKNHLVVLKAIKKITSMESYRFQVLFTGNEHDYRSPEYIKVLKSYIHDNSLDPYVKFLGFIDRKDQLKLMSEAIAIIQPSLFEGWSTVVEDAKALNQSLLLSNLRVHKEQCGSNALYFDPYDENSLSELLEMFLMKRITFGKGSYSLAIESFGRNILDLCGN